MSAHQNWKDPTNPVLQTTNLYMVVSNTFNFHSYLGEMIQFD